MKIDLYIIWAGNFPWQYRNQSFTLHKVVMWCAHKHTHSKASHLMVVLLMCAFWFLGHVQGWSVLPQHCWLFINGMCSYVCTANDMGAAFGLATQTANHKPEEAKAISHLCIYSTTFFSVLFCFKLEVCSVTCFMLMPVKVLMRY